MTISKKREAFKVSLPHGADADLKRIVEAGYPHETCGVMIGRHVDAVTSVEEIVEAKNLNTERAHDRFELDPDDFVAADAAARKQGLDVVGIWHSHPDHPAKPSQTDLERAWQGWSYIIVSVTKEGVVDTRSWRLQDDAFVEESVDVK